MKRTYVLVLSAFMVVLGVASPAPREAGQSADTAMPSGSGAELPSGRFGRSADDGGLLFEPNIGQAASGVGYMARGEGYALLLSPVSALIALRTDGMDDGDDAPAARPSILSALPTKYGGDCSPS